MTCTSLKKFTGWIQSEGAIDRLENVRLAYKELVNEARKETTATVIVAKVCLFWEMGFQGVNLGLRRHFFLSFENSDKIKFHKKTLMKSIDRTCIFQSGTINRNPMVVVGGVDPEGIFPCTMFSGWGLPVTTQTHQAVLSGCGPPHEIKFGRQSRAGPSANFFEKGSQWLSGFQVSANNRLAPMITTVTKCSQKILFCKCICAGLWKNERVWIGVGVAELWSLRG